MDMILDGLAFAALVIGQVAAVVAVRARRETPPPMPRASPPDYRSKLILEGGGS
jgi:hypothetical protein